MLHSPTVWEGVSFSSEIGTEIGGIEGCVDAGVGVQDDTFVSNALHFFRQVMKGFLQCGDATKAFATFKAMQSMCVSPTFSLMKSLLRGFGCDPLLGVVLLETLFGVSVSVSFPVSGALGRRGKLYIAMKNHLFITSNDVIC